MVHSFVAKSDPLSVFLDSVGMIKPAGRNETSQLPFLHNSGQPNWYSIWLLWTHEVQPSNLEKGQVWRGLWASTAKGEGP